jgi:co-chaperonin GroES (HSP10)
MAFLDPIGDDVIIHPFEHSAKIGSLYVPDTAKRRVNQGIIIAKGPLVSNDVDTADHVFFNGYTGDKVVLGNGGEFFVVPESHLICKLRHSSVVLMDTKTVKRIIQERFGELQSKEISIDRLTPQKFLKILETSLLDRIDTISIAEGWEF